MHTISMRFAASALLLGIIGILSGCGQSSANVAGTVKLGGKAVSGGSITFHAPAGRQTFSTTIDDSGNYSIKGIFTGDYRVTVEPNQGQGMSMDYSAKMKMMGKGPMVGATKNVKNEPPPGATLPEGYKMSNPNEGQKKADPIPTKYAKPEESGLSATIKSCDNTHNVDL
jgi:hypothetical protein